MVTRRASCLGLWNRRDQIWYIEPESNILVLFGSTIEAKEYLRFHPHIHHYRVTNYRNGQPPARRLPNRWFRITEADGREFIIATLSPEKAAALHSQRRLYRSGKVPDIMSVEELLPDPPPPVREKLSSITIHHPRLTKNAKDSLTASKRRNGLAPYLQPNTGGAAAKQRISYVSINRTKKT